MNICKLFFDTIEDKNPPSNSGNTPLHYAAIHGQLEICKFIFQNVEDKHPPNRNGRTPKDLAKEHNNLKIWQFFHQDLVTKKCKNFKCLECSAPPFSSREFLLNHSKKFHDKNSKSFKKRKSEIEISKLMQGITMVPHIKRLRKDEINVVYID